MDKVKFSCSECPGEVEAHVGEGEDVQFECKECGKCVEVRRRRRSAVLRRVALPVVMIALFAVAAATAISYHRKMLGERSGGVNPRTPTGGGTLQFLEWSRKDWTEWSEGRRMDVVVSADRLSETFENPMSGARMAVTFRENSLVVRLSIESVSGKDDRRKCLEMAHLLDPKLAHHLGQMVKRVPNVSTEDLSFYLGNTAYTMGAHGNTHLWVTHISSLPPDTVVRRLPGPLPAEPR